jgi:ribosome biogenesis protein BRX1
VKKEDKESKEDISLVEIGPRFVLNPIRIFNGSFGGEVLYENPEYVSPNALRAMFRSGPASKYSHRVMAQRDRQQKTVENRVPRTELDDVDEIFRK